MSPARFHCATLLVEYQVKDVLFVSELDGNLLSVPKLVQRGFKINFENKNCFILFENQIIADARLEENLYVLNVFEKCKQVVKLATANINLWHCRLGHRDVYDLSNKFFCAHSVFSRC